MTAASSLVGDHRDRQPRWPSIFSPRLFDYGLVWLFEGFLLLLARTSALAPRPWRRESLAAFDRC